MAIELTSQLAFRVPKVIVEALDRLAKKLVEETPGTVTRRSDAARVALYRGLEQELAQVRARDTEGENKG
ncbi:MAG: hypothetical protein WC641_06105 [Patescibacteria group bacterium]